MAAGKQVRDLPKPVRLDLLRRQVETHHEIGKIFVPLGIMELRKGKVLPVILDETPHRLVAIQVGGGRLLLCSTADYLAHFLVGKQLNPP